MGEGDDRSGSSRCWRSPGPPRGAACGRVEEPSDGRSEGPGEPQERVQREVDPPAFDALKLAYVHAQPLGGGFLRPASVESLLSDTSPQVLTGAAVLRVHTGMVRADALS